MNGIPSQDSCSNSVNILSLVSKSTKFEQVSLNLGSSYVKRNVFGPLIRASAASRADLPKLKRHFALP